MKRLTARAAWGLYFGLLLSQLVITPAHAYLDPGSGSILFQAIVGGAMAVGLGIKLFWRRIVALFTRRRPGSDT